MDLSDIHRLYAYNLWANTRLFSALAKVSAEQFSTPIQSSFGSLRDTTFHIFAAEWIWLKRWTGKSPRAADPNYSAASKHFTTPVGLPAAEQLATVADLQRFADSIEQERQEFIAGLDEATLHANLRFTDMAGTAYSEPLVDLLQHVVNHGTYHRGQATTLLRQLGAETVSLDMLYFFREMNMGKQTAAVT